MLARIFKIQLLSQYLNTYLDKWQFYSGCCFLNSSKLLCPFFICSNERANQKGMPAWLTTSANAKCIIRKISRRTQNKMKKILGKTYLTYSGDIEKMIFGYKITNSIKIELEIGKCNNSYICLSLKMSEMWEVFEVKYNHIFYQYHSVIFYLFIFEYLYFHIPNSNFSPFSLRKYVFSCTR